MRFEFVDGEVTVQVKIKKLTRQLEEMNFKLKIRAWVINNNNNNNNNKANHTPLDMVVYSHPIKVVSKPPRLPKPPSSELDHLSNSNHSEDRTPGKTDQSSYCHQVTTLGVVEANRRKRTYQQALCDSARRIAKKFVHLGNLLTLQSDGVKAISCRKFEKTTLLGDEASCRDLSVMHPFTYRCNAQYDGGLGDDFAVLLRKVVNLFQQLNPRQKTKWIQNLAPQNRSLVKELRSVFLDQIGFSNLQIGTQSDAQQDSFHRTKLNSGRQDNGHLGFEPSGDSDTAQVLTEQQDLNDSHYFNLWTN